MKRIVTIISIIAGIATIGDAILTHVGNTSPRACNCFQTTCPMCLTRLRAGNDQGNLDSGVLSPHEQHVQTNSESERMIRRRRIKRRETRISNMNQRTMPLNWGAYANPPSWCGLNSLNLNHSLFDDLEGVYIIWYWDRLGYPITVKVGKGEIRTWLRRHSTNFPQFYPGRNLFVTWAEVHPDHQDGVENFLGNKLRPEDIYPCVNPIAVNLPWRLN